MLKIMLKLLISLLFILSFSIESGGKLKGEGIHTFYLYSQSSSATIKTVPEDKTDHFIYFKNSLKGESVTFTNKEKAINLLKDLNANSIFIEQANDFYCEYFYSEKIDGYIMLNGQRINLHLSITNGLYTVGSPIIFGSF